MYCIIPYGAMQCIVLYHMGPARGESERQLMCWCSEVSYRGTRNGTCQGVTGLTKGGRSENYRAGLNGYGGHISHEAVRKHWESNALVTSLGRVRISYILLLYTN